MLFKIEKQLKNSLGRAGVLQTPHGVIYTPAFVPVGTKASVKALTPEQVGDLGAEVILANTYHLYLQPGDELVAQAGGLHKFMNWPGPIITDSGGFQVFFLGVAFGKNVSKVASSASTPPAKGEWMEAEGVGTLAKIGQDGVSFKSHLDGSTHYITPEKAIQIQHNLGADIIFAFDECTSPVEDLRYQREALKRTHRWAERSLAEHWRIKAETEFPLQGVSQGDGPRGSAPRARGDSDHGKEDSVEAPRFFPALFGIVQGGRDENLRKKSARFIGGLDFDGFGIGGSFAKEDMSSTVKWVNGILPEDKPRHLLGIGEPEDLFMGIENGVDLFDCVAPTRNARNGTLYTKNGKINITNTKYKDDFSPIENDCRCYVCGGASSDFFSLRTAKRNSSLEKTGRSPAYTRAYLAHLFRSKEMLAATLASIHNLYFVINLVKKIRQSILDDNFLELKEEFLRYYAKQEN